MSSPANARLVTSLSSVSDAAGVSVILVGFLVLIGWALDIAALKSVFPGLVTMKANTALAFILTGMSLRLLQRNEAERRVRRIAQACAVGAACVGLLTLAEHVLSWDFGVDQLLFREPTGAAGTSSPGRMAPNTALSFVIVGLALQLLNLETRRGHRPAQWLALTAALIALLALIGYAYGVASLYGVAAYTQMALHTALAFAVLCIGVMFARPDRGLMAMVTADSAGGVMARRLLPAAIGVPLVLGWLRLQGQRAGLYETEFGVSLFAVAAILALAVLTWMTSRILDRADAQHRQAELERRKGEAKFRAVAESAHDAIISADSRGNIVYFNKGAERNFRYSAADVTGRPLTLLMPERFHDAHRRGLERFLSTGEAHVIGKTVELAGKRKDGSEFPLELSLASWQANDEIFFTGILRDLTERKRVEQELRLRSAQLEAANKELEAFSYSVSHDLRAPLRSIDGFAQATIEDYADQLDARARDYLQRMRAASQRMGQLIDDLLTLSRVTRSELRRDTVDLSALAESIADELRQTQPGRRAEFVIAPALMATGDARLLRVVLENLLGNAWKFTAGRPSARIEFGDTEQNGRRVYWVRDNGAGFDMTYADKLFGAFQRLHAPAEFPGSGIGLASVQRIVHRHGGRVWAEGAVEQGATFYFTLDGP